MLNLLQCQMNGIDFRPLQTHQLFERAIGSRATRKCDLWLFHANVVSPRQIRCSRGAGRPAHQLGFGPRSMTPPPVAWKSYYRIRRKCNRELQPIIIALSCKSVSTNLLYFHNSCYRQRTWNSIGELKELVLWPHEHNWKLTHANY